MKRLSSFLTIASKTLTLSLTHSKLYAVHTPPLEGGGENKVLQADFGNLELGSISKSTLHFAVQFNIEQHGGSFQSLSSP